MNDNSKSWVDALRSGKYKQGRGFLRDEDDRFCCLGVACELAVEAGVIEPPELSAGVWAYKGISKVLPNLVRDWLGFRGCTGEYSQPGLGGAINSLSYYNDYGVSFEEIADIIESEPDGLFA